MDTPSKVAIGGIFNYKNPNHNFNVIIITLGAVTVVSIIVVNSFFDANPLGRTKELFGKFFLQEKKRKIQVKDWINTYNELHYDDTTGFGNHHLFIPEIYNNIKILIF